METWPRIGLVGAGPVGSLLASALLEAGRSFHWVVRNPQRRTQLAAGLNIRVGQAASQVLPLHASCVVADIDELPELDWLVLAVKAYDVQPLLARQSLEKAGQLLVVANGLHENLPWLGVLEGGARLIENGTLCTSQSSTLYYGPLPGDCATPLNPAAFEWLISCQWLTFQADSGIELRMWEKAARNCIVNPLTAILDVENAALLSLLDSPLLRGLVFELTAVLNCRFRGLLAITEAGLLASLRDLLQRTAGNSSSMREDLRHGRLTEVRQLNLAIAEQAQQLGMSCPLTSALGQAVLALESLGHGSPTGRTA